MISTTRSVYDMKRRDVKGESHSSMYGYMQGSKYRRSGQSYLFANIITMYYHIKTEVT